MRSFEHLPSNKPAHLGPKLPRLIEVCAAVSTPVPSQTKARARTLWPDGGQEADGLIAERTVYVVQVDIPSTELDCVDA